MKVTVQIPALNEAKSLKYTLERIPKEAVDEILVIDGHSTDDTVRIAESLGCRVLTQPGKGYGDAQIFGFKNAIGDVIISMDADGSADPQEILFLLKKINEGYDLALGSRYLPGAGTEDDTFIRSVGNKAFTFLTNLIYGMNISDSLFFFAAAKKEMLNSLDLKSKDFALCIEVPVKAYKAGYKIGEVACRERPRFADVSRVNAFTDGFRILWQMLWW